MSKTLLHLEKVVPLGCLLVSFALLNPWSGAQLPLTVGIHAASYVILGLCFELPELSLNCLCLAWARREDILARHRAALSKILTIRYVLTHFIAPAAGIWAIASGIFLTYQKGYSFQAGWVFWILIAAVIGFYKGMCQHNAYLKHLLVVHTERDVSRLRKGIRSRFDQTLIFLEFPTYAFNFWAPIAKPLWLSNPARGLISQMEKTSSVWGAGTLVLISGCLLLIPLIMSMRRWSVVVFIKGTHTVTQIN